MRDGRCAIDTEHTQYFIGDDTRWAVDGQSLAVTVTPAGTLYLQPDGRITSDGAGLAAVNATIAIAGEAALQITGETGHVR